MCIVNENEINTTELKRLRNVDPNMNHFSDWIKLDYDDDGTQNLFHFRCYTCTHMDPYVSSLASSPSSSLISTPRPNK